MYNHSSTILVSPHALRDKVDALGEVNLLLERLKQQLEEKHFVWVPGEIYRALLVHFGASEDDLSMMESGIMHMQVQQDIEPTMHFRQIAFHRMLLEQLPHTSKISAAGCQAVTQISDKEICSDEGATVYFERSGTRKWNMPPKSYSQSSIPMAIAKVNDFLQPKRHHHQSNVNADSRVTINDQLLIRINKAEEGEKCVAEPTPEGVHQDGTEISSVTVVQRRNVASYGAESRIWKLEQPTGNYDSPRFGELSKESKHRDGFSWENCLFDKALESPWETIYFNDRMVKHEVRPFHREAGRSGPCHRDVIVNFVRKPLSDGSDFRRGEDEDEDSDNDDLLVIG